MIIEEGKFYKDENGDKRGPMSSVSNVFWKRGRINRSDPEWGSDGTAKNGGVDLVAEWTDEPEEYRVECMRLENGTCIMRDGVIDWSTWEPLE